MMYDYFVKLKKESDKKRFKIGNQLEHAFYKYYFANKNKLNKIQDKNFKNELNSIVKEKIFDIFDNNEILIDIQKLNFLGIKIIEENFEFKRSFFSKNDKIYHPDFNLVSKDWVSNQPYIKPSTWKGIIKYSFYILFKNEENFHSYEAFLFGKSDDKENIIGSTFYFPTFFDKNSLETEVITPIEINQNKLHPQAKPIKFQVIKSGTKGTLRIIFAPIFEKSANKIDTSEAIKKLNQAIKNLENIGIGAKTRIGWGKIKFLDMETK